jgi:hypothetical protein
VTLTIPRVVGLVAATLVVIGTGGALTRSGWPFGTTLLNIHKLVALAAVAFTGVLVYRTNRAGAITPNQWIALAAGALLCVAAFASGGVVSAFESAPTWVVWVHRVGSWLAVAATGIAVWLLSLS